VQLADALIPLLAQVRAFVREPAGDAAGLTAQLDGAIAAARQRAHDGGCAPADVDDALFAVCAWADEALLTARWDGAAQWQRHLLQRRYFSLSNAGVVFYERLAQLTPAQLPVREVYFLCVAMGFGGRYAYDRNQKALTDIRRANLALLLPDGDSLGIGADALLFPDGYAMLPGGAATPGRRAWRAHWRSRLSGATLAAILVPLAVLLMMYGIYDYVVGQSIDTLLARLNV